MGTYELAELLGRGGMAEVWKARDGRLHRPVAITLMATNLAPDPSFVLRFTREAQAVAALRQPNIVQVYDFHVAEQAGTEMADPAELDRTVATHQTDRVPLSRQPSPLVPPWPRASIPVRAMMLPSLSLL